MAITLRETPAYQVMQNRKLSKKIVEFLNKHENIPDGANFLDNLSPDELDELNSLWENS
jgi:hypothetical protein